VPAPVIVVPEGLLNVILLPSFCAGASANGTLPMSAVLACQLHLLFLIITAAVEPSCPCLGTSRSPTVAAAALPRALFISIFSPLSSMLFLSSSLSWLVQAYVFSSLLGAVSYILGLLLISS
jgi:hypothetical protein